MHINYPIKYESNGTNDLRGVAFTTRRTNERTDGHTEGRTNERENYTHTGHKKQQYKKCVSSVLRKSIIHNNII